MNERRKEEFTAVDTFGVYGDGTTGSATSVTVTSSQPGKSGKVYRYKSRVPAKDGNCDTRPDRPAAPHPVPPVRMPQGGPQQNQAQGVFFMIIFAFAVLVLGQLFLAVRGILHNSSGAFLLLALGLSQLLVPFGVLVLKTIFRGPSDPSMGKAPRAAIHETEPRTLILLGMTEFVLAIAGLMTAVSVLAS